jgi:nitric oxide reductase subunit B
MTPKESRANLDTHRDARSGFWKYALLLTTLFALTGLLFIGLRSLEQKPPIPAQVVDENGHVILTSDDIRGGQAIYQKYGLMDLGSVLGNGSYRAPDFTALTLHLMSKNMRDTYARELGATHYESLSIDQQGLVADKVRRDLKANGFDPATGILLVTGAQVEALKAVQDYYEELFRTGNEEMGIAPGLIPAADNTTAWNQSADEPPARQVASFFWWTAWASAAARPGETYSYTNNWPYEPAAGNTVTWGSVWSSAVSVTLLIFLTAIILLLHTRYRLGMEPADRPASVDVGSLPLSPSQSGAVKYVVLVAALFLVQTLLGGYIAHDFTQPTFFGIDLKQILPFQIARAWHLQLAIFWIATAWVAAGLFIAPLVSGEERKHQSLLVNILFGALVVVAVGSLLGEYLGVQNRLGNLWWWLGMQGWEYLELGRLWQILLVAGLAIWLYIVARGLRKALARAGDPGSLIHLLLYSAALIPFFYIFGLFSNPATNITIAEYWRWWVIHLWVEGIFEVFTVVVVATLFTHMGLVTQRSALRATYFQLILVLATGIIGTGHHYYFVGMPEIWLALGATFSALEVLPLTLLGIEAYEQYRLVQKAGRDFPFRGSFWFLIATAFWNLFGAGVLGFLINLPVVNFFQHGSFLTAAHGHGALAGVYGFLAVALGLFVLRGASTEKGWSERAVKLSFWGLNLGLAGMIFLTLLPVGLGQLGVAVRQGYWAARDGSFYQIPWVKTLLWLRMLPDTVFILLGVLPFLYLAVRVYRNRRPITLWSEGETAAAGPGMTNRPPAVRG